MKEKQWTGSEKRGVYINRGLERQVITIFQRSVYVVHFNIMAEYNCQHTLCKFARGDEGDQPKHRVAISDAIEAPDRLRINEGQQPARDWGPKISRVLHHMSRDLCRHKLLKRGT